jgi:small subunit ribosomal protein S6
MNTYEAFITLKPILDVDNSDNVLKTVEEAVDNLKGKVLKKEKLGRKRLAYEIKKFKDGFLTTYQLSLEPNTVADLRRTMQLNEDVLRFVLVARTAAQLAEAAAPPRERNDRGDHRDGGRPDRGEFRPRREHRD